MAGIMFEKDETAISRAICQNDLVSLKSALEAGEDPHYKDRKGNTYLHYLCTMNRPYLIHALIATGIDLNATNRHGNTALHVTALQSECCHVGDLMAAGIDARIKNKDGKSAAEVPTRNSIWKKIYERYEPGIFEAIDSYDVGRVVHLLDCWSRVDTTRNGLTLRQFAACRKYHDIVYRIDSRRHTLEAIYAVLEDSPDKAWPFLSHNKCNVNLINAAGEPKHILQQAVKLTNLRLVRMICSSKVNVNVRVRLNNFLMAPLFFCVLNAKVSSEVLWSVLRSGCDFRLRDERGRNAAMFALDAWMGECPCDVIAFMMKHNLDVSHRDGTGVTLRDVARFYCRKDVLSLIDKAYVRVIRASDIPELERLCVAGYDGMLIDFNYKDTFIYASGNQSEDVLNFIQWTPTFQLQVRKLFHCIRYKSLEEVTNVLEECRRPDLLINARDKGGHCPMHLAILFWRFDVIKLLLKIPGIDVTAVDNCGRTALHYACSVEEEDERTEFCSMLTQAGIGEDLVDFTGHKASAYKGCAEAWGWLAKERKTYYSMKKQLACVDKYGELCRMMKGKGKTVRHFNEAVKHFKYPVPHFHGILSPLMPKYRDLLHIAMDYGKEDIAVRLVQLGNSLSIPAEVIAVTTSDSKESETKNTRALERARFLNMDKLVGAIEKRMQYEKEKKVEIEKSGNGKEEKVDRTVEKKRLTKIRHLSNAEGEDVDVVFEEEEVDDDEDDKDDDEVENKVDNEELRTKGDDDDDDESANSFYSDSFDDDDDDNDDNDDDGDEW